MAGTDPVTATDPVPVTARPRRTTIVAVAAAAFILAGSVVVGLLLKRSEAGTAFHTSDQVSMIILGLLIAVGLLVFARPLVVGTTEGIVVRNVGTTHRLAWPLVEAVTFPDGAAWATLQLRDDETLSVLAVQAVDGDRAVRAVEGLRALHAAATAGGVPPRR